MFFCILEAFCWAHMQRLSTQRRHTSWPLHGCSVLLCSYSPSWWSQSSHPIKLTDTSPWEPEGLVSIGAQFRVYVHHHQQQQPDCYCKRAQYHLHSVTHHLKGKLLMKHCCMASSDSFWWYSHVKGRSSHLISPLEAQTIHYIGLWAKAPTLIKITLLIIFNFTSWCVTGIHQLVC